MVILGENRWRHLSQNYHHKAQTTAFVSSGLGPCMFVGFVKHWTYTKPTCVSLAAAWLCVWLYHRRNGLLLGVAY